MSAFGHSKHLECDRKPHGTSAHAVRSLSEVGFVSGECHEKFVGLICGGAFDPCDGRSRHARRCENCKGQAAVSSDKAPGGHNLKRSHEASVDAHLNCKNWRSDAVALSASQFSNTRTGGFNGQSYWLPHGSHLRRNRSGVGSLGRKESREGEHIQEGLITTRKAGGDPQFSGKASAGNPKGSAGSRAREPGKLETPNIK